jgi:hypothetical protein
VGAAVTADLAPYANAVWGWTQPQITVDGILLNYNFFPLASDAVWKIVAQLDGRK